MKKIKCMLFAGICLLVCSITLYGQSTGDVDGNGSINIVDALLIAQYYVGLNPANFNSSVADTDCSGGIDIVDALLISQYYVGLISQFPCSTTPVPTPAPTTAPGGTPPEKTVRVFWLRPNDYPYDQQIVDGIANVMRESQRFYFQELGVTFRLNDPIVEVCDGDHPQRWYETDTSITTDPYWISVFNGAAELKRKYGLQDYDPRWVIVEEISAEGDGAGGGGGGHWVLLPKHDVDGAAGYGGNMNRWYGGMVHELGHAFMLPDSTYTDGTPMSASFYDYPNCHFTQEQINGMLNDSLNAGFWYSSY
ncbi:hypothetical protein ES702_07571 [subsurface metagenome]